MVTLPLATTLLLMEVLAIFSNFISTLIMFWVAPHGYGHVGKHKGHKGHKGYKKGKHYKGGKKGGYKKGKHYKGKGYKKGKHYKH